MSDTLIRVEGLSKKFSRDLRRALFYGLQDIGYELTARTNPSNGVLRKDEFWSIKDVNFELKRGESMGLIGRNGAGKSTLLKLLSGLIKPATGRIEMRGRVGSLIELGSGFNPVLTGRENVYINGAILGLSQKKIDSVFDQIVDFSELEEFIDTPVQYYSSGMQVRLGFSVAINMEPDVLLIDEVLAVGDTAFKHKCYNAIYKLIDRAAVIFVSHSMSQVGKVCNRGLLLRRGEVAIQSHQLDKVIDAYYNSFDSDNPIGYTRTGRAELLEMRVFSKEKELIHLEADPQTGNVPQGFVTFRHQDDLEFEFKMRIDPDLKHFDVGFGFMDMESKSVAQCYSRNVGISFENNSNVVTVRSRLPHLELAQGRYTSSFGIYGSAAEEGMSILYIAKNLLDVHVASDTVLFGTAPIHMAAEWKQIAS